MDIKSGNGWPSSALSNFAPHQFEIDGIFCASMEGFLQSLKFELPHIQVEICKLVGVGAKRRGKGRNKRWQSLQTLWWQGQSYKRDSKEYQKLLDRAYEALSKNTNFQKALIASRDATISHSIGHNDSSKTVLSEKEFVSRLTKIRSKLLKEITK